MLGQVEPRVRYILADTAEAKRRAFEREMKYLEDHPLDRTTRPGGYHVNGDGSGAYDREGRRVPVLSPEDETAVPLRSGA